MTPWADLTDAEFTSMHGLDSPSMACQFFTPPPKLKPTAVPKPSIDYVALGATVAVKNQGKVAGHMPVPPWWKVVSSLTRDILQVSASST